MKSISNIFRFINRKRHAAGYGVHSQFAFELIMDTIHTPYNYYIYEDNKKELEQAGLDKHVDKKYAELLFRLINRFNSKEILEIGSGVGANTLYLSALSKKTKVTCVEQDEEKRKIAHSLLANKPENTILTNVLPTDENCFDAIVWDLKQNPHKKNEVVDTIGKTIKSDGFVIVNHINRDKKSKTVWQNTLQLDKLTMSFDLGTIGIGFFKPSLPKLNYDIYF